MEKLKYKVVASTFISDKMRCYAHDLETGYQIGKCAICYGTSKWSITEWFVEDGYKREGIGKQMMKLLMEYLLEDNGRPTEIVYTWNNENEYVYEWLIRNFNAVCLEDRNAIKYKAEITWESSMFKLDVERVFKYFNLN